MALDNNLIQLETSKIVLNLLRGKGRDKNKQEIPYAFARKLLTHCTPTLTQPYSNWSKETPHVPTSSNGLTSSSLSNPSTSSKTTNRNSNGNTFVKQLKTSKNYISAKTDSYRPTSTASTHKKKHSSSTPISSTASKCKFSTMIKNKPNTSASVKGKQKYRRRENREPCNRTHSRNCPPCRPKY